MDEVPHDSLLIGVICAHELLRTTLAEALHRRGHGVAAIAPLPISDPTFAAALALIAPCKVVAICPWGIADGGRHLVHHLSTVHPQMRLVHLVVTADSDESNAVFRAGATAVIGPHTTLDEALDVIDKAARGDSHLTASSTSLQTTRPRAQTEMLSRREVEIVQLLVDGLDISTISARLYISTKTVKHHLSSTYAKLQSSNRTEAVVRALRLGLVHLDRQPGARNQASSGAAAGSPSGAWPPSL